MNNNTYEILMGTSIILGATAVALSAYIISSAIINRKRERDG